MEKQKKIAFYTFGCRLNQAETAVMRQGADGDDWQIVDFREEPDVLVVNTCTVTENGDADTRRLLNRVRRQNPEVEVALVGCQAQVQKSELLQMPNVRWVVGNARKEGITEIIANTAEKADPQVIAPTIRKKPFTIEVPGVDIHHTRGNLKIQDGCDFFCSFCEIPYARGRARSREYRDIMRDAQAMASHGHHELVLTGVNIGTYRFQDYTFFDVLDGLKNIEDLWRVRISSIEPTTIDQRVIHEMGDSEQLCRYLHIPLQSGSDSILTAMRRKYTVREFVEFLDFADQTIADAGLGTDVIVGFPGETDALFEETYKLLSDLPLAYFHVFSYSDRGHAQSSKYSDKIARPRIAERSARLRELSDRKRTAFFQKFVGKTMNVLFESQRNGNWSGLTDNYIRVKVSTSRKIKNQLLPVRLTAVTGSAMTGELIS